MDRSSMSSQSQAGRQQAVEEVLQGYARFGVELGLDRIERLLAALGNPQKAVPGVHVAGTNGKGSVCAYLSSVLTAAGYRTGRYTSPHLVSWNERICLDGSPIGWDELYRHLLAVDQAAAAMSPPPTQFEVFTAAAWVYFAAQAVDVAIIEVGLGGRLDATNVLDQPLATVIVSIGRDHWQRLGDSLAKIAWEKAGILKAGVPAIVGPLPAEAMAVVCDRASQLQAPLTSVFPATEIPSLSVSKMPVAVGISLPEASSWLHYGGISYPQALLGDHQRTNSACAIAVIQALRQQGWQISDEAIIRGMGQAIWPGRLQKVVWKNRALLIDGAHNAAAAQSLRTCVSQLYGCVPVTWLIGMLADKDHEGVFSALLRPGDGLHLVPVDDHHSAHPQALGAIAKDICPDLAYVNTYEQLEDALIAATRHPPTVFCGSLYLIGRFYRQYPQDAGQSLGGRLENSS